MSKNMPLTIAETDWIGVDIGSDSNRSDLIQFDPNLFGSDSDLLSNPIGWNFCNPIGFDLDRIEFSSIWIIRSDCTITKNLKKKPKIKNQNSISKWQNHTPSPHALDKSIHDNKPHPPRATTWRANPQPCHRRHKPNEFDTNPAATTSSRRDWIRYKPSWIIFGTNPAIATSSRPTMSNWHRHKPHLVNGNPLIRQPRRFVFEILNFLLVYTIYLDHLQVI